MLYGQHYYHQLIKKYTQVMGAIFSNIDVIRINPDNSENHRIKVGVTQSSKEKWVRRVYEDPDLLSKSGLSTPMIGFQLEQMQYAPSRKLSSKQRFILRKQGQSEQAYKVLMPVPYDFIYSATVVAKTQEDLYQIIEQILPFFTPDLTFNMRGISNPSLKFDVPITLTGIQIEDSYDGEIEDRRVLMADLSFVMKAFLFGPIRDNNNVITSADIGLDIIDDTASIPNIRNVFIDIGVEPFIDGLPISQIDPEATYDQTVTVDEKYACQ